MSDKEIDPHKPQSTISSNLRAGSPPLSVHTTANPPLPTITPLSDLQVNDAKSMQANFMRAADALAEQKKMEVA